MIVLSYGFRPLFICTAGAAILYIAWWVGVLEGVLPLPANASNLIYWHAHEMLFGFVGSAMGGFLLTAVANWTGRPPVQGAMLAAVVLAWIAARVIFSTDLGLPGPIVVAIDASYFALLTILMGREIIAAGNLRNLQILLILTIVTCLNVTFHFYPDQTIRLFMMLACILVGVIGGRIIPAFTGNWLRRRHGPATAVPAGPNHFDHTVMIATALFAALWTFAPNATATAPAALVCGALHLARMSRWMGHRTITEPLLLVLHIGYGWLGTGFMLLGALSLAGSPPSAALHALAVGGLALMIAAVSSRAAMGHTGRPLVAGTLLTIVFTLITVATLARVLAAWNSLFLDISAALWIAAFSLYALRMVPILLSARVDNPG